MAESGSLTVYPGAYDSSASSVGTITSATNPVGKGSSNASYCTFATKSSSTEAYTFWPFDVSVIPEKATIDSVSCNAKAGFRNSSYVTLATMQLYSGNTPKGSSVSFVNYPEKAVALNVGTWTRAELASCRLKVTGKANSSSDNYRQFYFFGADLTIQYTVNNEKFMLRIGSEENLLPEGYTRLDYIEGTGQQYIDMGFVPNQDSRVVLDVEPTKTTTAALFGARKTAQLDTFVLFVISSNSVRSDYGTKQDTISVESVLRRVVVDKNKNVCSYGENKITQTAANFNCGGPLALLTNNFNGSVVGEAVASAKIYSCKIYDNGTIIRDCYPCTNASGVPGLYDIVNGVFYGSATSTPFVAGPEYNDVWHDIARTFKKVSGIWVEQTELANVVDQTKRLVNGGEYVVELPAGYTRLGYIEGTGTQYINTNFKPKYNSRVVMSISGLGTEKVFVFGSRDTAASTAPKQFALIRDTITSIRTDYFGTNQTLNISDTFGRTLIDKNANVTSLFGEELINAAVTSGECANPMFIFTANSVGEAFSPCAKFKLYYCQIFDNGTLIRDYVPCTNISGNPGLYDLVHGVLWQRRFRAVC